MLLLLCKLIRDIPKTGSCDVVEMHHGWQSCNDYLEYWRLVSIKIRTVYRCRDFYQAK